MKYRPEFSDPENGFFVSKDIKSFRKECSIEFDDIKPFLDRYKNELNQDNFCFLFQKWDEREFNHIYSPMILAHFLYLCGIDFAKNMTFEEIAEFFPNYLERFEKDED